MTVQIQSEIRNVNTSLGLANRGVSVCGVEFHKPQVTKIYQTSKRIFIERYQREYEIEYAFVDGEFHIWSVDGNTDVEDTYSESFLNAIQYKIEDRIASGYDNDEGYDDLFQNLGDL